MTSSNPLFALLESAAGTRRDEVCIVEAQRTWTAAQLLARTEILADCLDAADVRAGDRVLIRGRNSGDLVARIFAAWRLGALAVPIHAQLGARRFTAIMADARPSVYLVDDPLPEASRDSAIPGDVAVIRSSADSSSVTTIRPRVAPALEAGPRDPAALLMYTSGSTATPLGVECPAAAVEFALNAVHQELAYNERDRVLCLLPLAFDYGLYQVLLAIKANAVVVLEDGLHQPHRVPRLLAEQSITVFPAMPSIFGPLLRARWLSADHQSLRLLTSTGESFPPSMIDGLRECLPAARVAPMYGLTECKRVSIQDADVPGSARHSVGRALPGTTAWVGDDLGRPKPSGQEGELFVRGQHLMAGYWRNPAATTARYREIDGLRTLCTGDIFRMDGDGYLAFVRREGGFLKSKGHRLSPAEIETVLVALPEIREAVAVGYTDPDGEDRVAAFLLGDPIDEARVRRHCMRYLQREAAPALVHWLQETLPCGPNGKYDRAALVALAQELSKMRKHSR